MSPEAADTSRWSNLSTQNEVFEAKTRVQDRFRKCHGNWVSFSLKEIQKNHPVSTNKERMLYQHFWGRILLLYWGCSQEVHLFLGHLGEESGSAVNLYCWVGIQRYTSRIHSILPACWGNRGWGTKEGPCLSPKVHWGGQKLLTGWALRVNKVHHGRP